MIGRLPVFPTVALQVIELSDNPERADLASVGALVERDATLSAETLKRANSARYNRRIPIADVRDAVRVLGLDAARRVALSTAVRGMLSKALGRPALRRSWESSLSTGILAEAFAPLLGQHRAVAYTAGLLHDLGRLALLAAYPDEYDRLSRGVRSCEARLEAERTAFGVDHGEAGVWVVEDWGLPAWLVPIVRDHHATRPFAEDLETAVGMAVRVTSIVRPALGERPQWRSPAEYLATLPLPDAARFADAVDAAKTRIKAEVG